MRVWLPALRAGSGADVFTERLGEGLLGAGIDARITWFHKGFELAPDLMGLARPPEDIDIIHANGWLALPFRRNRVPLVATVHHLVHDPAYAPYRSRAQALYHNIHIRRRERAAILQSDAVTSVSSYVANSVEDFCGRRPEVVPNWVDATKYRPGEMATASNGPVRLLMVGNRTRRKGADLIAPFVLALGRGFELRCTGGLRAGVETGLPGVRWLGTLSEVDLIEEYQRCDAVVSLSRYEGFGYSALEAMACGKAFLGFRTSGLAEVVDEGVTGALVEPEDVEGIARECRAMAYDRARLADMGRAGRLCATTRYAREEMVGRYVQLYRRLLSRG